MKIRSWLVVCAFALLLSSSLNGANENAIASRTATVDGVKLYCLMAGHGPTVILLHSYTQTSRMWKPIIPLLANKFTVIAIGGEKANADVLGPQAHAVALETKVIVLKNTGHWVLEENPKETTDALMNFL